MFPSGSLCIFVTFFIRTSQLIKLRIGKARKNICRWPPRNGRFRHRSFATKKRIP